MLYQKNCMTVVVPVYNRPHLIGRCLDGLLAQSYRPLHVIVVDNASSDSTVRVVEEWMHEHSDDGFSIELLHEPRRGASYARQTGLEHVKTEKVMFFDSDDVMRPDAVEKVMCAWQESPEADAVAWPLAVHKDSGARRTHSISGNLIERHLVHAIFCTLGYAVKADTMRLCGGWRGEYPVWDDLESGVRLLLISPKVKGIGHPLADVYPQAESITGLSYAAKAGMWEHALDGIDRCISASGHAGKDRLHSIVSYRRAILAADYAKEGHPELALPLYHRALSEVGKTKRPLIRFAYHWTRLRMRGAFSIVGRFL